MSCFPCCQPQQSYVQLVNEILPKGALRKDLNFEVSSSKVGRLTSYIILYPGNTLNVASLLQQHVAEAVRANNAGVIIACLHTFRELLSVCKEAGHAYLLQSSILATLRHLFKRRRFEYFLQASQLFVQYSLVYSRDSYIEFIPTALSWCSSTNSAVSEDTAKCGYTLLYRLIEITIGHNDELDEHLPSIVSAIWQNIKLPMPELSSGMYKDILDFDFKRELSVSDYAWLCLNLIATSAPPVLLVRLIAIIINGRIATNWVDDSDLIGAVLANIVTTSRKCSYFDVPTNHILIAYIELLLPNPVRIPVTRKMKKNDEELSGLADTVTELVFYFPTSALSLPARLGDRKSASMTDLEIKEVMDKTKVVLNEQTNNSFVHHLQQLLKLSSLFSPSQSTVYYDDIDTDKNAMPLATKGSQDSYVKSDVLSLLNALFSLVLSSASYRQLYTSLDLCAEPSLYLSKIYLPTAGEIGQSGESAALKETLSMIWGSISILAENIHQGDGHATSAMATDLSLQILQYLHAAENTVRRPKQCEKSVRSISSPFRKSSITEDEDIGEMSSFVNPLRVYLLQAVDTLIMRSFNAIREGHSILNPHRKSIAAVEDTRNGSALAQHIEQAIVSSEVAAYLANLFQSDDWPVVAKTASVFVDLITLRHRASRIGILEALFFADDDDIPASGGGVGTLSHAGSMVGSEADRKSLSKMLGDEAAAAVAQRRLAQGISDNAIHANLSVNGVTGAGSRVQRLPPKFIGGDDINGSSGAGCNVRKVGEGAAVMSTLETAHAPTFSTTSNPWYPLTEDAAYIVRDAIFNKLCSCASDAARQTIAAWEVMFHLLSVGGLNEVLASLPMVFTLEEFWRLYPFEESQDQEFVQQSAEMLACQRLFFVAYFLTIGKLYRCPGLEVFLHDVIGSWSELKVLSSTLLFDLNNLVFAVKPVSASTGAEAGAWKEFSSDEVQQPSAEEPRTYKDVPIEAPTETDEAQKSTAGAEVDDENKEAGLQDVPLNDADETPVNESTEAPAGDVTAEEPLGTLIELPAVPPAVNRVALLQVMLEGESFRTESTRLRHAFEMDYQPQSDPFERKNEIESVRCAEMDSGEATATPHKSPMRARGKRSEYRTPTPKSEQGSKIANSQLYSPSSLGTPSSKVMTTGQTLGDRSEGRYPSSGKDRTPLWKEKYRVAKEGGLAKEKPRGNSVSIVMEQLSTLATPSKVHRKMSGNSPHDFAESHEDRDMYENGRAIDLGHGVMSPGGYSYESVPTEDVLTSVGKLNLTPISRR